MTENPGKKKSSFSFQKSLFWFFFI
jgi:hypothetical protein